MDKRGRSKGYGYVCFSTADEASEAIKGMDGQELGLKPISVTLASHANERSQKPIDTQRFYSSFAPRNITGYSQTPPPIRFSTRLSSSLHTPISQYPSPIHLRENTSPHHQYSFSYLAALQSKNSPSSTEDEKSDTE